MIQTIVVVQPKTRTYKAIKFIAETESERKLVKAFDHMYPTSVSMKVINGELYFIIPKRVEERWVGGDKKG